MRLGSLPSALRRKLQMFVKRCLRTILKMYLPEFVPNATLWRIKCEDDTRKQIEIRRWYWIGHTLRKRPDAIEREALDFRL